MFFLWCDIGQVTTYPNFCIFGSNSVLISHGFVRINETIRCVCVGGAGTFHVLGERYLCLVFLPVF